MTYSKKEGIDIWYVMYCPRDNVGEVVSSLRRRLDGEVLQDVFTFSFERMKRYQGEWHLERMALFPGYVFLQSGDGEALSDMLDPYRRIALVMEEKRDKLLIPVREEERRALEALCGGNRHMAVSRGYIQNGNPYITEGPLRGKESLIRKIDRHKRIAELELIFMERPRRMTAGVEIISKS